MCFCFAFTIFHASPLCCAGSYTLQFTVSQYDGIPPVDVTVHVVNCSVGDVTVSSGDACQECPYGSYSLDPRNSSCDQCMPNAECPGGAQILPLPGFWHSSPRSHQLHRCVSPLGHQLFSLTGFYRASPNHAYEPHVKCNKALSLQHKVETKTAAGTCCVHLQALSTHSADKAPHIMDTSPCLLLQW